MELPRALTQTESETVNLFKATADKRALSVGIGSDWSINSVAEEAGIDLWDFPKEGVVIQAFWISLLSVMKKHKPKSSLKYPDVRSFQAAYNGYFDSHDANQLHNLFETANWMTVLFTLIPAKKNKGLAMAVVPKLIEGWYAKYVTGSGQTKATADRVKIFETEGNWLPKHRGYSKPKKKSPKSIKRPRAERLTIPSVEKVGRRKIQKEKKAIVIEQKRGVGAGVAARQLMMTRSASGATLAPSGPSISRYFESYSSFVNNDDLEDDAADLAFTDEDQSSSEDGDDGHAAADGNEGGANESFSEDSEFGVKSELGNVGRTTLPAACEAGLFMESSSDPIDESSSSAAAVYDTDYLAALSLFRSTSASSVPTLSRVSSSQSTMNFAMPAMSRVSSESSAAAWCGGVLGLETSKSIDFSGSIVPNEISIESVSQSLEFLPGLALSGVAVFEKAVHASQREDSSSSCSTSSSSSAARPLQMSTEVLSLQNPAVCRTDAGVSASETAMSSSGGSYYGASEFELTMSSQDSQHGWGACDMREDASGYIPAPDYSFQDFGICEAKEDGTSYDGDCGDNGGDHVGLLLEDVDDESKISPRSLNAAIFEALGDLSPMTPLGAAFTPCFTAPAYPLSQQSRI